METYDSVVKQYSRHPYIIVVDYEDDVVVILKQLPEIESMIPSTTNNSKLRLAVSKKILKLFNKLITNNYDSKVIAPLSHRQIEILKYIADGQPNKCIALSLGIGEQTVKNHVTSIKHKLKATDRTQAVVLAIRNGLLHVS